MAHPLRILILGGTTESRNLAKKLATLPQYSVQLSLAGRTTAPAHQNVNTITGGFGGAEGLAHYIVENDIQILLVATHPFALAMAENAYEAMQISGVPTLLLQRQPWHPSSQDNWIQVHSMEEAVEQLGPRSRRVFLTIGRQQLQPFLRADHHHYLIRSIDSIMDAASFANVTPVQARGPFSVEDEVALMREHDVDILVTKNSGSDQVSAKLEAARILKIPVIMVERPTLPDFQKVESIEDTVNWIDQCTQTLRGV